MAQAAFTKAVRRCIKGSIGRFLAIAGIVALGCGFYAGLRMTPSDMRIAADDFYDSTRLYDIRLVSTLGFSEEGIAALEEVQGVEGVMPGYSADAMTMLHGEQCVMRISSFPEKVASGQEEGEYQNQLVLVSGQWPDEAGECLLSADSVTNSPASIGDSVEVLYGTDDIGDTLETTTFTVCGFVHAPAYVCDSTLGSTTLGSGSIDQYMYVPQQTFSDDLPYTELYVIASGAEGQLSGSDAYQATVDALAERIESMQPSLGELRYEEVRSDALSGLDDAKSDLADSKASAEGELSDALSELEDAAQSLEEARDELESGQAEWDEGYSAWKEGVASWQEGYTQWREGLADWQAGQDEWQSGRSALDEAYASWQSSYDELEASEEQWQSGMDAYEQGLSALDEQRAQVDTLRAQLAAMDPSSVEYAELEAQIAAADEAIEASQSQLDSTKAQLDASRAQLDSGKSQLDSAKTQLDEQSSQLDSAKSQLDASRAQLDASKTQLDASRAQLDSAKSQLDESAATLESGRQELESGQKEYDDGLKEYEDARSEADQSFAEAQSEIDEAQSDIDAIEQPSVYVLDRTKNYGVAGFDADAGRVDNIAKVFPFIFFLVAALVALTTMTRMVEEERIEIGTYKALGYSKGRILSRYLSYAAFASVAGAIVGIAALSQVLPAVIMRAYSIIYNVPQLAFPLPLDWAMVLLSGGMGVGITLLATFAAVMATLREAPASLMLPRSPKAGKRILLERIRPLWSRISFSWKVTSRNLFRYKKRLFMTVIGIAGCTALLLTGLGLHNSIWDIIDFQFYRIMRYNVVVGVDEGATSSDIDYVCDVLGDNASVGDEAMADRENMQAASAESDAKGVTVVVPQDPDAFRVLVDLKDRESLQDVQFDSDSVLMTEKLANTLGISAGDTFTLYEQDDIGNATGAGSEVKLDGIVENYVGDYIYMGSQAFQDACGKEPVYHFIYATCTTDDHAVRAQITDAMHATGLVDTVSYNDEMIDSYRQMLSSVNMIVYVLVIAAAALAFIVLYNLTNINVTERRREIASLKVLGFTTREVNAYIFREITALVVIGAFLGLVLGIFLERFVVVTAEVDQVMFGRDIHALSFVLAFALTLVFAAFVMLAMRGKLKKVSMAESLKSVD